MKKLKLALPVFILALFLATGCNDSASDSSATAKDTAATTDTIKSDPNTFSQPH
jgi:hypothetical protein